MGSIVLPIRVYFLLYICYFSIQFHFEKKEDLVLACKFFLDVTKYVRLQHLKSMCKNMFLIEQKRILCFDIKFHSKLLALFILTNQDALIASTKACMSIIFKPHFSICQISVLRLILSFLRQIKPKKSVLILVDMNHYSQCCAICIIFGIARHFKMVILPNVVRFLFFHVCNNLSICLIFSIQPYMLLYYELCTYLDILFLLRLYILSREFLEQIQHLRQNRELLFLKC